MDRELLLQQIALTERLVAEGRVLIEMQERVIADLQRHARSTTRAVAVLYLDLLRQPQTTHEQRLESLRQELDVEHQDVVLG